MKHTGIIYVFAECNDCPFTTEDHRRGIGAARRHAKRRKHRVKIDVGKIEIVDHRTPSTCASHADR